MQMLTEQFYTDERNPAQVLDVWFPEKTDFDILIYFHGGGLCRGSRASAKRLAPLVEQGYCVVSADYRMMPDSHFPDFLYDAAQAVAYTQKHAAEWGGNGRIFVSGASAGAYISMMLCLDETYYRAAGVEPMSVTGYISESAQQFAHFGLLRDRGFDSRIERIDETAPIGYLHDGLVIPPLALLYYSRDMLCRPEENRLMYASMKRFLPEESYLTIEEIPGGHTKPDDPAQLTEAYARLMRAV